MLFVDEKENRSTQRILSELFVFAFRLAYSTMDAKESSTASDSRANRLVSREIRTVNQKPTDQR